MTKLWINQESVLKKLECQWYFVVCVHKLLENKSKHLTLNVGVSVYILWIEQSFQVEKVLFLCLYSLSETVILQINLLQSQDCVNWESNRGNETDCKSIALNQSYQKKKKQREQTFQKEKYTKWHQQLHQLIED